MSKILTNFPLDKQLNRWYNEYIKGKENPPNQKGIDSMTKLTKKAALKVALDALNLVADQMTPSADWTFDEVKDKLNEMVAQLDKKTTSSKQTKAQQENEAVKEQMLDLLGKGDPMRATDVAQELGLSSGQKAAALLNALVKEGLAVKVKGEKGATLFSLPDPDEE